MGGDLTITDNLSLCEDDVDALVAQLTTFTGTVTNTDKVGTRPSEGALAPGAWRVNRMLL